MSDPIEELRGFAATDVDVRPLPPAEVRRLGERRRRRTTALASAAGVAAVAVLVVPLALVARGTDRTAPPPPVASPSATAVPGRAPLQRIPAGFDLTSGFPARNGSDGTPVRAQRRTDLDVFPPCLGLGDQRSAPAATVDRLGVSYTGESEDHQQGVLALYRDADAAAAALDRLRSDVAGCPAQASGDTTYLFDAVPSDLGEESFTWTMRLRTSGELSSELLVVQNVRVGNAIYSLAYDGAGGATRQVIDFTTRLQAEKSATVVSDMRVFARP